MAEARSEFAVPPEHAALAEKLLAWFDLHQRALPWRTTYDPYAVWLSEIMLQQTQMERAVEYFERWMRRFPSLNSVAESSLEEVLKAWEGLGYYSRARNLHKAARMIQERHGGVPPSDYASLRALPGIGDYTAGAILSIAFNQPVPAVDANVERVFSRLFDIDAPVKSAVASDFIRQMARMLIPPGKARVFNQALMELGALVCGKKPLCASCPVSARCQARRLGIVAERPVPGKKVTYAALEIISGVLVHQGRLFLQKRQDSGVWAGFWEFPGGRLEAGETPEQGVVREFMEETEFAVKVQTSLGIVRHAYTRYRIRMHCFICAFADSVGGRDFPEPVLHAASAYRWVLPDELTAEGGYVLPAGHRKMLDAWLPELRKAASCGNALCAL